MPISHFYVVDFITSGIAIEEAIFIRVFSSLPWSISVMGYSHTQGQSLPPRFHVNEHKNKLMFYLEDVSPSKNYKNYTGMTRDFYLRSPLNVHITNKN